MGNVDIKAETNQPFDAIQKRCVEKMEAIDNEILKHEEIIKRLNENYTAYARFLEHYRPFEQGNLSQSSSLIIVSCSGATPQSREEAQLGEEEKKNVGSKA